MVRKEFIMAKFKIGDKVRILDGRKLGLPWKPNMDSEIGKNPLLYKLKKIYLIVKLFIF